MSLKKMKDICMVLSICMNIGMPACLAADLSIDEAVDMALAKNNDVKIAIASLYGVVVLKVTTSNLPHKGRMNRKTVRRPLKKAVITLKKGDTIAFGA